MNDSKAWGWAGFVSIRAHQITQPRLKMMVVETTPQTRQSVLFWDGLSMCVLNTQTWGDSGFLYCAKRKV